MSSDAALSVECGRFYAHPEPYDYEFCYRPKGHDGPCKFETRRRRCAHEWEYDDEESRGPWTGYIERCARCGALQQVPQ